MSQARSAVEILVVLSCLSSGSCDETLPLREDPERVLEGAVECAYVLTALDNSLKIYLTVKNVFDETLQEYPRLTGKISITSVRDESVQKVFTIASTSLITAPAYNPATDILTLNPQETIRFGVSWNLTDDSGRDLRTSFFRYILDPSCDGSPKPDGATPARCLAFTEEFKIEGEVTVFKQRAPVIATALYSLCFASRWVNPKYCPPIITAAPCNLLPPQQAPACFPKDFLPVLGKTGP